MKISRNLSDIGMAAGTHHKLNSTGVWRESLPQTLIYKDSCQKTTKGEKKTWSYNLITPRNKITKVSLTIVVSPAQQYEVMNCKVLFQRVG